MRERPFAIIVIIIVVDLRLGLCITYLIFENGDQYTCQANYGICGNETFGSTIGAVQSCRACQQYHMMLRA